MPDGEAELRATTMAGGKPRIASGVVVWVLSIAFVPVARSQGWPAVVSIDPVAAMLVSGYIAWKGCSRRVVARTRLVGSGVVIGELGAHGSKGRSPTGP